jgi:hypothetical protein
MTAEELTQSYAQIEVGMGFTPQFKTMPANTNVGSGQNQMRLKKLVRMNMRVVNTYGLKIEDVPVPSRNLGAGVLDSAPNAQTGIIDDVYNLAGWKREEMPLFTCPDPTPFTVLSIEYEVESS